MEFLRAARTTRSYTAGFTLMELMIVVAIIAFLAAIALPSYNQQVRKSRRTDGHNILMRVAAEQERFYTSFNRYATSLTGVPPAGLGFTGAMTSEHGHYIVTLANGAGNQIYTLTATPQGPQADDACGSLTLGSSDAKGFSGDESNGRCW